MMECAFSDPEERDGGEIPVRAQRGDSEETVIVMPEVPSMTRCGE